MSSLTCEGCGRSGRLRNGLCWRCGSFGQAQIDDRHDRANVMKEAQDGEAEDDFSEESDPDDVYRTQDDYREMNY